jgi:hypothetical protein
MMSNTTAIAGVLARMDHKFDLMCVQFALFCCLVLPPS